MVVDVVATTMSVDLGLDSFAFVKDKWEKSSSLFWPMNLKRSQAYVDKANKKLEIKNCI